VTLTGDAAFAAALDKAGIAIVRVTPANEQAYAQHGPAARQEQLTSSL
jgi:hypothetical protein